MNLLRASVLLLVVALSGCGGGPTPGVDAGATDSGDRSDARGDAGTPDAPATDAGVDAAVLTTAPIFRSAVAMSDDALAREALRLMGAAEAGGSGSCNGCHGITRESIRHFRALSDTAWSSCFADLEVETPAAAARTLLCFREGSNYSASKLGIFSSGGYFDWFRYVFQQAVGAGWEDDYDAFAARVAMPPEGHTAFTQAEFDLVTEWFLRGTPNVDDVLPPTDVPGTCTSYVGPEVAAIVTAGATDGWSARNEANGILMHGCAGAATPEDCLSSYPLASSRPYGSG